MRSGNASRPSTPHAALHDAQEKASRPVLIHPARARTCALNERGSELAAKPKVLRRANRGSGEYGAYVETSGSSGNGDVDGNTIG